jgi:hypothetical protein
LRIFYSRIQECVGVDWGFSIPGFKNAGRGERPGNKSAIFKKASTASMCSITPNAESSLENVRCEEW